MTTQVVNMLYNLIDRIFFSQMTLQNTLLFLIKQKYLFFSILKKSIFINTII